MKRPKKLHPDLERLNVLRVTNLELFQRHLGTLPKRYQMVLLSRLKGRTLKDVGIILSIGKERARQIQLKAIRMLRHPSRYGYNVWREITP